MGKASFDVNVNLKTLNNVASPDPRIKEYGPYFGAISSNCPNPPNTLKLVKPEPQMAFEFE